MKAFTSFRREFKALYKPRASEHRDKEQSGPLELEDSARPWTAPTGIIHRSSFVNADIEASTEKDLQDQGNESSPRPGAEGVAATVDDILASNKMSPKTSEETTRSPVDVAHVTPPDTPMSGTHDELDAVHEEAEAEPQEEEGEAQELTFEEAQAIRDDAYIVFNSDGEEIGDYTQGPARFVLGTDGVQQCAVLLMTLDLSARIQTAMRMHHEFEQAEIAGLRQRQAFMRFENRIESEIANCRAKTAKARDVDAEKEAESQQQLEVLELLLDDVQSRRETIHVHLETQAEELRDAQAAANALLEEAYICARVIEEDNGVSGFAPEELDLETEYAAFCEKLKYANDTTGMIAAAPPLDTSREYDEAVLAPSEEDQAYQKVIDALWASRETLDLARRDFEEREETRGREFQENQAAADRAESTEDFDVRWVQRYAELTRDLINAEAAYADTKRMAFEAGVPLPFEDNETVCDPMDDGGVGYTISKEKKMVDSAPCPTVRRWLDKVPEGVEVSSPSFGDGPSDADEWEAEEVGISDSVSLVAEGRERVRIDRWRDACVAEKEE